MRYSKFIVGRIRNPKLQYKPKNAASELATMNNSNEPCGWVDSCWCAFSSPLFDTPTQVIKFIVKMDEKHVEWEPEENRKNGYTEGSEDDEDDNEDDVDDEEEGPLTLEQLDPERKLEKYVILMNPVLRSQFPKRVPPPSYSNAKVVVKRVRKKEAEIPPSPASNPIVPPVEVPKQENDKIPQTSTFQTFSSKQEEIPKKEEKAEHEPVTEKEPKPEAEPKVEPPQKTSAETVLAKEEMTIPNKSEPKENKAAPVSDGEPQQETKPSSYGFFASSSKVVIPIQQTFSQYMIELNKHMEADHKFAVQEKFDSIKLHKMKQTHDNAVQKLIRGYVDLHTTEKLRENESEWSQIVKEANKVGMTGFSLALPSSDKNSSIKNLENGLIRTLEENNMVNKQIELPNRGVTPSGPEIKKNVGPVPKESRIDNEAGAGAVLSKVIDPQNKVAPTILNKGIDPEKKVAATIVNKVIEPEKKVAPKIANKVIEPQNKVATTIVNKVIEPQNTTAPTIVNKVVETVNKKDTAKSIFPQETSKPVSRLQKLQESKLRTENSKRSQSEPSRRLDQLMKVRTKTVPHPQPFIPRANRLTRNLRSEYDAEVDVPTSDGEEGQTDSGDNSQSNSPSESRSRSESNSSRSDIYVNTFENKDQENREDEGEYDDDDQNGGGDEEDEYEERKNPYEDISRRSYENMVARQRFRVQDVSEQNDDPYRKYRADDHEPESLPHDEHASNQIKSKPSVFESSSPISGIHDRLVQQEKMVQELLQHQQQQQQQNAEILRLLQINQNPKNSSSSFAASSLVPTSSVPPSSVPTSSMPTSSLPTSSLPPSSSSVPTSSAQEQTARALDDVVIRTLMKSTQEYEQNPSRFTQEMKANQARQTLEYEMKRQQENTLNRKQEADAKRRDSVSNLSPELIAFLQKSQQAELTQIQADASQDDRIFRDRMQNYVSKWQGRYSILGMMLQKAGSLLKNKIPGFGLNNKIQSEIDNLVRDENFVRQLERQYLTTNETERKNANASSIIIEKLATTVIQNLLSSGPEQDFKAAGAQQTQAFIHNFNRNRRMRGSVPTSSSAPTSSSSSTSPSSIRGLHANQTPIMSQVDEKHLEMLARQTAQQQQQHGLEPPVSERQRQRKLEREQKRASDQKGSPSNAGVNPGAYGDSLSTSSFSSISSSSSVNLPQNENSDSGSRSSEVTF